MTDSLEKKVASNPIFVIAVDSHVMLGLAASVTAPPGAETAPLKT